MYNKSILLVCGATNVVETKTDDEEAMRNPLKTGGQLQRLIWAVKRLHHLEPTSASVNRLRAKPFETVIK